MKKIVIDAGHGGKDPGACGFGMQEKDLVLTIAQKIAWYLLQEYEVDVTMTRNDDTFVELNQRDDVAENINADLFLSIHCNSFNGKARGFESFVYHGHRLKPAGRIQDVVHGALAAYCKSLGMPDRGKQEKDLAVLRETDMPAVLLEYAFVDQADDARLLKAPGFIESAAKITADSMAQAMALPVKQKPPQPPTQPLTPAKKDDITGHWAEKEIRQVLASGEMELFNDGTFQPDQPLTRAQFAYMKAKGRI